MSELSSQAQAVPDAYMDEDRTGRLAVAAAIRAAADRIEAESIWHHHQEHTGVRWSAHQLRNIAAELEGHHA